MASQLLHDADVEKKVLETGEVESDDEWEDFEGEEEAMEFRPLLQPNRTFATLDEAIQADKDGFGLDVREYVNCAGYDEYMTIRLINFIRTQIGSKGIVPEDIVSQLNSGVWNSSNDEYLLPVLENDSFIRNVYLMVDRDEDWGDSDDEEKPAVTPAETRTNASDEVRALESRVRQLEAQLESGQKQLEVARDFARLVTSDEDSTLKPVQKDNDTYYFDSYSHLGIHEAMLRDEPRTGGYERAIINNPNLFEDKRVIDVGCGTGILSMFAAKAGAKVVGIDSSSMLFNATQIVKENGLDEKISLIHRKMETLTQEEVLGGFGMDAKGDCKVVDVIVSEWMGYCLLFESMLPSVLDARDKYMRPGGTLFPNQAVLYLEAWSDVVEAGPSSRFTWWKNVHGFDLSSISTLGIDEARVETVDPAAITTTRATINDMDLNTITVEQLDFERDFSLTFSRDTPLQGFVASFDVGFTHHCDHPVTLSTTADSAPTHWKQTLFLLDPSQVPQKIFKSGTVVEGSIAMRRGKDNPRDYDIAITWRVQEGSEQWNGEQVFHVRS